MDPRDLGNKEEISWWKHEIFEEPPIWYEGALSDWVARPQYDFPYWIMEYFKIDKPILLEVGCGPLPKLEWGAKHGLVEAYASDPLWGEYQGIRDDYGIEGKIKPVVCKAEEAANKYPKNFFDGVYVRNCLDHSENPVEGMKSLREVLRRKSNLDNSQRGGTVHAVSTGGLLFFEHAERVGTLAKWSGLHQWDLYESNGRLWAESEKNKCPKILDEGFQMIQFWRVACREGDIAYNQVRAVLQRVT